MGFRPRGLLVRRVSDCTRFLSLGLGLGHAALLLLFFCSVSVSFSPRCTGLV